MELQGRPGSAPGLLRRRHVGVRVDVPPQRPAVHRPGVGPRRPLRHVGALPRDEPARDAVRVQRDDDEPGHLPARRERAGPGHGAHRPGARRRGAAALPPARVGGGGGGLRQRAGRVRRHVVPAVHAAAPRRRGVRVPEGDGPLPLQHGRGGAGHRAVRA
ncbi:hypothetical protein PR202_ga26858 [Eleusine coracana subsp. coracana]|uniref:Uncharacterized protein n=1 Tax=Eleusine coracana subsp. coracana TaxID=191504 RepID=A0AAV5DEE1_ELECO|nr:hypothetical protein PR202_ga26858 [Eleusine coracana subsp. coracana]